MVFLPFMTLIAEDIFCQSWEIVGTSCELQGMFRKPSEQPKACRGSLHSEVMHTASSWLTGLMWWMRNWWRNIGWNSRSSGQVGCRQSMKQFPSGTRLGGTRVPGSLIAHSSSQVCTLETGPRIIPIPNFPETSHFCPHKIFRIWGAFLTEMTLQTSSWVAPIWPNMDPTSGWLLFRNLPWSRFVGFLNRRLQTFRNKNKNSALLVHTTFTWSKIYYRWTPRVQNIESTSASPTDHFCPSRPLTFGPKMSPKKCPTWHGIKHLWGLSGVLLGRFNESKYVECM